MRERERERERPINCELVSPRVLKAHFACRFCVVYARSFLNSSDKKLKASGERERKRERVRGC